MVPNTSELLPEPETPVNTVSRRFGISTLMSLRLFTRAPCTRIRSWRSATGSAGNWVSVLFGFLIVSPFVVRRGSGGRHSSVLEQPGGLLHGAVGADQGCDRRTAQPSSW